MGKSVNTLDPSFNSDVTALPGGEHLNMCFACGACSGICPVSQAIPEFDPRKIIHMVRMGMRERVLDSNMLWYCSGCESCVFVCPQDVRFKEIMSALMKMAVDEGYVTEDDLVEKGQAARVERDKCVACLTCVRVCPWDIPVIDAAGVADINVRECRGCGICAEECPARAIIMNETEDERLLAACSVD